jgi:hypothetical protein
LREGNDKNLCTFLRLLSNKIGIGKTVAIFSKLTSLIFCNTSTRSSKNNNSDDYS